MTWKSKFFMILIISIPAFTGLPVDRFPAQPVDGIYWLWVIYFFMANILLRMVSGWHIYENILAITAVVTLPVVFGGASVSKIVQIVTGSAPISSAPYSAHYAGLCLNMLTVVPIALGMVSSIPFRALEQEALSKIQGISPMKKMGLMVLRVFNHIVFFVAPNILEVMKEEILTSGTWGRINGMRNGADTHEKLRKEGRQVGRLVPFLVHMAIEGICSAIQNIPLWAVELSRLPNSNNEK